MKNTTEYVISVHGKTKLRLTVHCKAFEERWLHNVNGKGRVESMERVLNRLSASLLTSAKTQNTIFLCQNLHFFDRTQNMSLTFENVRFLSNGHRCGLTEYFEICTVGFLYRLTDIMRKTLVALSLLILKYSLFIAGRVDSRRSTVDI